MPIHLRNPFNPRRASERKSVSFNPEKQTVEEREKQFGLDITEENLKINDEHNYAFDQTNGDWKLTEAENKEDVINVETLKENNMLKLKVAVLTDLLAEALAEIDLLKNSPRSRKTRKMKPKYRYGKHN